MKLKEYFMGRKKKVEVVEEQPEVIAETTVVVEDEVIKKDSWVESLPSNVTVNLEVDVNDPRTRSDR